MQHTAAHCSTLQHPAAHCSTLQHTATHRSTLQHTATHCDTLQHIATHCNTLQQIVVSGIRLLNADASSPRARYVIAAGMAFGLGSASAIPLNLKIGQCVAVCCSVL